MKSLFLVLALAVCVIAAAATPLDDYVRKPDPSYKWETYNSVRGSNYTIWNIKLTSQTWMNAAVTDVYLWKHWLSICIPDECSSRAKNAILYIDGGSNTVGGGLPAAPTTLDDFGITLCQHSGTVVANLGQVPNQPMVFSADPQQLSRSEDAMIAWTWKTFMNSSNPNPEILARMPMTKAAVRAMDTVQSFMRTRFHRTVHKFVVTGGSKRGWATWTTAAVDRRVSAMAPIVMPMGNMNPMFDAMYRAYGNWSFALADYVNAEVLSFMGTPQIDAMEAIIDPMVYYDRYRHMPKYVVGATLDEFFLPDSARFWWDKLPGEKILRVAPNLDHSMIGPYDLAGFVQRLNKKLPQPKLDFVVTRSNTTAKIEITIEGSLRPTSVTLWQSTAAGGLRDWRMYRCTRPAIECVNTSRFAATALPIARNQKKWSATVSAPAAGYTAFLIEAAFPSDPSDPSNANKLIHASSDVNIVPDRMPFASCLPHSCQPSLPWTPYP